MNDIIIIVIMMLISCQVTVVWRRMNEIN